MDPTPGEGRTAAQDDAGRGDDDRRDVGAVAAEAAAPRWQRGFHERLIGGIVLLTLSLMALAVWVYLTPEDYLQTPELQPVLRVTKAGTIPVGGSRVVTWGDRVILVVRSGENDYTAVSGLSPIDGCILRWDAASLRVVSPCSFVVYGLDGNVVRGNTMVPLRRYSVFIRHDDIFVTGT
jgi:nitrite reductase/ring-hydroxylating ferredoxin subunit